MAVVYIREQGAIVRKRGGRLLVEKDRQTLAEIRLRETDSVSLFGAVQVTTQALTELLDAGIPLALHTRNGRLKGSLSPAEPKNVDLRLAQYRRASDPQLALPLARALVEAKLANGARLLADHRARQPSTPLAVAVEVLLQARLRSAAASSLEELLGFEGAAAARYWKVFPLLNRSPFRFDGRNRRPPRDPLNVLLGLAYTLFAAEIRGLAEGLGLEPHIGFLHRPDYGRPSLALDLLEPFRPVAERFVLNLVNRGEIRPADFATDLRPDAARRILLRPAAFPRFLERYERHLAEPRVRAPAGYRALIRADVEALARSLRDDVPFRPWTEEID